MWENGFHMNRMKDSRKTEKTTCEMLLDRYKRKSFLHRIVTGDEKWIHFENPKRKRSWVAPKSFFRFIRK